MGAEGFTFTAREFEVLQRIVLGKRDATIGKELYIARSTVRTHVYRMLKKVGGKKRTGLAAIYVTELATEDECVRWQHTKTAIRFVQGLQRLTVRERSVIEALVRDPDISNRTIGQQLGLDMSVVKTDIKSIRKKCGISGGSVRTIIVVLWHVTNGVRSGVAPVP